MTYEYNIEALHQARAREQEEMLRVSKIAEKANMQAKMELKKANYGALKEAGKQTMKILFLTGLIGGALFLTVANPIAGFSVTLFAPF